nr:MAG TPA: hypothetical protein [Caudoviricetes sp.]
MNYMCVLKLYIACINLRTSETRCDYDTETKNV